MKNNEFHIPFIRNLIFILMITIVSMGTARILVNSLFINDEKTPIFTSAQSQDSSKQAPEKLIGSISN